MEISTPAGPRPLSLWLHIDHGAQANRLGPLAVPLTAPRKEALSVAQAFATAEASKLHATRSGGPIPEPHGIPCRIDGDQLRTQGGEPIATLFFADVSCAPFSTSLWPNLAVIAILPPASGTGLSGIAANGVAHGEAWFVLCQGVHYCKDILDALAGAGCLRSDLEEAYSATPDGGIIGEGAYATVLSMRSREGYAVAVKKMNASVGLDAIDREVATLLHVQPHEHIVGYRGIFWTREAEAMRLAVVFDVAPCGDLLYKVLKTGTMTEGVARPLFAGVMRGLAYIHSKNIVHRDIKAENILLKRADCAVVADFGLATWVTDEVQMARRCGSPGYVAPEVCLGTPYGFKVDVFGAGIVLYFMLSKEMPFSSPDRDTAATMRRTVKCSLHLHRPPWDTMSSRLRNVLRQMICKSTDERLSAADTLEHPWMQMCGERHNSQKPGTSTGYPSRAVIDPPSAPADLYKTPLASSAPGHKEGVSTFDMLQD